MKGNRHETGGPFVKTPGIDQLKRGNQEKAGQQPAGIVGKRHAEMSPLLAVPVNLPQEPAPPLKRNRVYNNIKKGLQEGAKQQSRK